MTTYNTGNPIGSTAVKDLYDDAENFDVAVNSRTSENWYDRLGVLRWTYYGMEQRFNLFMENANYEPSVPYAAGLNMVRTTQTGLPPWTTHLFSQFGRFEGNMA